MGTITMLGFIFGTPAVVAGIIFLIKLVEEHDRKLDEAKKQALENPPVSAYGKFETALRSTYRRVEGWGNQQSLLSDSEVRVIHCGYHRPLSEFIRVASSREIYINESFQKFMEESIDIYYGEFLAEVNSEEPTLTQRKLLLKMTEAILVEWAAKETKEWQKKNEEKRIAAEVAEKRTIEAFKIDHEAHGKSMFKYSGETNDEENAD